MANGEICSEGPVDGVHPLLQHAAHALLQVRHDIEMNCSSLEEDLLWRQAGKAATIGFHLTHLPGTIDVRLSPVPFQSKFPVFPLEVLTKLHE